MPKIDERPPIWIGHMSIAATDIEHIHARLERDQRGVFDGVGIAAAVDVIDLGQGFLGQIVRIDAMRPKPGQDPITQPGIAVIVRDRAFDIAHPHSPSRATSGLCSRGEVVSSRPGMGLDRAHEGLAGEAVGPRL